MPMQNHVFAVCPCRAAPLQPACAEPRCYGLLMQSRAVAAEPPHPIQVRAYSTALREDGGPASARLLALVLFLGVAGDSAHCASSGITCRVTDCDPTVYSCVRIDTHQG